MTTDSQPTFTLFVCGDTVSGGQAKARVEEWADKYGWVVTVVDVIRSPDIAEKRRILATPTLIREDAVNERRIVGDLRDAQRVLEALSLNVEAKELSTNV